MVPHGYLSDNEGDVEVGVKKSITEERKVKSLKELSAKIIGPQDANAYFGDEYTIQCIDFSMSCLNYDFFRVETVEINERKFVPISRKMDFPEEHVNDLWNVIFYIIICNEQVFDWQY